MGKAKQSKSLNLAAIFFVVFGLLILSSIILKVVNVFQRSSFDGKNQLTVLIAGESDSVSLISFSPKNSAIYLLSVKDGGGKNLRKIFQIPIDGEVHTDLTINEENIKGSLFNLLAPFKIDKTNLTVVDLFRLWLYANSVSVNSIYQQEVLVNDDLQKLKSLGVYSYFVDQGVAEEKIPIEVINGTEVFGLGNKLAIFLSNMGANVVMVSTSQKPIDKSKIVYFEDKSYTLKRLSETFDFPIIPTDKKSFGKITIVIGKDALDNLNF